MTNDERSAEQVRAEIKALTEEYKTLTGNKLLVRRIKTHRPQEIWAGMNSLAHEYSVITGKKFDLKKDHTFPMNSKRGGSCIAPSVARARMK